MNRTYLPGFVYGAYMFDPTAPYQDLPPLPPSGEVETPAVLRAVIAASRALASLDAACGQLSDPTLLINIMPVLDAQASSEIENIVTTNDELFRAPNAGPDASLSPAAKEALRYRSALHAGFASLDTRPLTVQTALSVCSELHGEPARIRDLPGTFIGNPATSERIYTPPQGKDVILETLGEWERFLHHHGSMDPLVVMALQHYQFEDIHPFFDGNGRTGRILNLLCLKELGLPELPVLHLSGWFVRHKENYYRLLRSVTTDGAWEDWVLFAMRGVEDAARSALELTHAVVETRLELVDAIREHTPRAPAGDLASLLTRQPYARIDDVIQLGLAQRATASKWLTELAEAGMLTKHKVGRSVVFGNTLLLQRMIDVQGGARA